MLLNTLRPNNEYIGIKFSRHKYLNVISCMSNPLSTLLHCGSKCMQVYILLPAYSISKLFIDGTDVASEGTFVSSATGEALLYTNWGSGEPSNSGAGEDCIEMSGDQGFWNDYPCTATLPTFCEIDGRKFQGDA